MRYTWQRFRSRADGGERLLHFASVRKLGHLICLSCVFVRVSGIVDLHKKRTIWVKTVNVEGANLGEI